MDFAVDHKHFKLRAGNFTITRPWQLHKLGAPNIGPGRLHWLILDVGVRRPHQSWRWPKWVMLTPGDLAELTRKLRRNENPIWTATPAIANAFREIARGVTAWGQPHSISRLAANLNLLLIGILDALTAQQAHEDQRLTTHQRSVEIFLRDLKAGHIHAGEPWTLDKMAAHCGMGVTAFSKYCRGLVNAGPVEYLNQCRLDLAAEQIRRNMARSVTDIAYDSGFNSSQYFATAFRKRFKTSPSSFRQQLAA
jgi:AraC family L-rhamnose operon regulatory protein RhaS